MKQCKLVLSSFKDNIFARNHSDIFPSSKFGFQNNGFISLFQQKKLVSSANMIDLKNCDPNHMSFI